MTHNNTFTPLTPAVLHILLALSMEERHGYGIMKQVEMDSRGKVTAVRLKVEENQLVDVFGEIGFHIDGLKGA